MKQILVAKLESAPTPETKDKINQQFSGIEREYPCSNKNKK
jgi:hypothetical protein